MLTFGFSTSIDLLSWTATLSMALKLVSTIILLAVGKHHRDRPGWGSFLWWITKVTPVIAIPCLIAVVLLEGLTDNLWILHPDDAVRPHRRAHQDPPTQQADGGQSLGLIAGEAADAAVAFRARFPYARPLPAMVIPGGVSGNHT